ncbi:MAG TPA: polysaccharide biosynthesis/export family protein [Elusimicrobiota bacterium]|nr:polysaccharide biosynthesis/export family protein [Elusimicrobiota bacterium]
MIQQFIRPLSLALIIALLHSSVAPATAYARPSFGDIQKIDLIDGAHVTTVTIRGHYPGKCQPVVLREPKGSRPPKIFLPFVDTLVRPEAQGTRAGAGAVDSIDIGQLTESPSPLAQVVIALTSETPYHIKRLPDGLAVDIDKPVEPPMMTMPASPIKASGSIIQAGDMLYVTVYPAEELSRDLTVDQNGKIFVPLVGTVEAAGSTPETLAHKLTGLLAQYVTNPKVDVLVRQFSAAQVSLLGQVRNPGSYPFKPNLRLMDLVSMAGGFMTTADKRQIRIYRGSGASRKVSFFDVSDALKSGDVTRDFVLQAGDLIDVPKGVNPLTIFGEVMQGGNYDFYAGMRLLDLIALSHGFKDGANFKKITIFRGEPPNQKVLLVRFNKVMDGRMSANVLLEPGDTVFVPARALWTYSAFVNTVLPAFTLVLSAVSVYLAVKK